QHGRLFDKNEKNALIRAGALHERGQHRLRRLREIPLRRHLGTEIRQGFDGAHQAPKIFFLGGHPRSEQHTPEQFESTTVGMTQRWEVCWLVWCVKSEIASLLNPYIYKHHPSPVDEVEMKSADRGEDYFAIAESWRTVLMTVVVARVSVRSRRYATPSSRHSSSPLIGMSLTRPASTWSRAKLALIMDTPSPAATKLLIMPTLGNSMRICSWAA